MKLVTKDAVFQGRGTARVLLDVAAMSAAAALCACANIEDVRFDDGRVAKHVQYINEGEICLYADGFPDESFEAFDPQVFEVGSRLAATVTAPECLSSSCDVDRAARCWVDLDATTLTLGSYLAFDELDADMCTLDCGRLVARCESEPLGAGVYEVVHGDRAITLVVPSMVAPCSGPLF